MSTSTQYHGARRPGRFATLATIALLALAPIATPAANAEETLEEAPGAGTEFVKCQNHAWADYNKCLMDSGFRWERNLCDLAFEADVAWCTSVYYRRLKFGV